MKRVISFSCFAAIAMGQQSGTPVRRGEYNIAADQVKSEGRIIRFSGHVLFETDGIILRSDQAEVDSVSNEIKARETGRSS